MFKSLIAKVKAVMQKMGLIKSIKSVSDIQALPVDDGFYELIETVWLPLYQGYLAKYKDEPFHEVEYMTIEGGKQNRRMHTLGMPKIVSKEMASLIFNEKCKINISDESLSEVIEDVFKYNKFYKLFQDRLEHMFALGGLAIKAYIETDRTKQKKIKIGYATADCFIPLTYSNDDITEGVFLNVTRKGDKWYTRLEWHTWDGPKYIIENQLFESDKSSQMGVKIPLGTLYPGLEKRIEFKGLSRPLFIYIKPNIANNVDLQSPLGISLYANAIDTIKALDTAFDSYHREFKLGKKRIIVPHTAVRTIVDRETEEVHRYFDANDEVYEAFNFEDLDKQQIVDNSIELRVEEHIKAIQSLLDILALQTGFSPGAFSFDGQGVKTATEVVSENSKTYQTKNSHENVIEEGIINLVISICELAKLFNVFKVPEKYEVTVDFDDSIAEDRDANATYYLKLRNGGLIPKYMALMRILKVPEEQAKQIIQEAQEEAATDLPDVDQLYSGGA
ncbi:phage portal protein [Bacillus spizizenii]|nr:phage portal protein [Bacillus spizizenii]MCY8902950.1 phage portal protein [Bacillus spizizenii]MCY8907087.1 phage portal protein [Bacillus spizizenii]